MKSATRNVVWGSVVAVVLASTGTAAQNTAPPTRVPVLVTSDTRSQGFSDPSKDRQDSIKDVQKKVKDSKTLMLVDSDEDAVIVIEVLGRETRREVNGWTALSGHGQNKSSVSVRMIVGNFRTEFSGESGSKGMMKGYGDAANKVVKQMEAWVKANRDKLSVAGR